MCKECGGSGICEHGRRRTCKEWAVQHLRAWAAAQASASMGGYAGARSVAVAASVSMGGRSVQGVWR